MKRIRLAELISSLSPDIHTKVGCVIIKDGKLLSVGYNKPPKNMKIPMKREGNWLDTKYPYIVHAEVNAVCSYKGNLSDLNGSELFVTLFPCNECAKLISTLGIRKVYYKYDRSEDIYKASKIILKGCGIEYEQIE